MHFVLLIKIVEFTLTIAGIDLQLILPTSLRFPRCEQACNNGVADIRERIGHRGCFLVSLLAFARAAFCRAYLQAASRISQQLAVLYRRGNGDFTSRPRLLLHYSRTESSIVFYYFQPAFVRVQQLQQLNAFNIGRSRSINYTKECGSHAINQICRRIPLLHIFLLVLLLIPDQQK